jgi:hypothetical protein
MCKSWKQGVTEGTGMLQQHRLQKRESNYKDNIEMVRRRRRRKDQTSESLFSFLFGWGFADQK